MEGDAFPDSLYSETIKKVKSVVAGDYLTRPHSWKGLAKQHGDVLHDVSVEAEKVALARGSALVAAAGVISQLSLADNDEEELLLLERLASVYATLYTRHCVVTEEDWQIAVRGIDDVAFRWRIEGESVRRGRFQGRHKELLYVQKMLDCRCASDERGSSGAVQPTEASLSGDDGSTAEEEFKLFLRRCLVLGRRKLVSRRDDSRKYASDADALLSVEVIKEMLMIIEGYTLPASVDW